MAIDLTGRKFGRLTVISRAENDKHNKARWICQCDCGSTKDIGSWELRKEHSKSCGCLRKEATTSRNKKSPYFWIYTMALQHAKASNKEFRLTYEDIVEFTTITECHYCKNHIKWEMHGTKHAYHGYRLDRMDNSVGYTKENCVVCCNLCNRIKGNQFTHDEMMEIGKFVRGILDKRK